MLAACLSGCQLIESVFGTNAGKLAQIKKNVLYAKDVQSLLPPGLSAADSIQRIRQYIDTWAIDNLLLYKAEEKLSKSEKDVEKELEQYRKSLLIYRYQKKYIEDRLDTLVNGSEIEKFYSDHPEQFLLSEPLLKARYIKIRQSSPYLEVVRSLYTSSEEEDVKKLQETCQDAADIYTEYDGQWIEIYKIGKMLPLTYQNLLNGLRNKKKIETKDSLYTYLVYCFDFLSEGQTAPLESRQDNIKQILLSKRKQDLLRSLETDVLNEGWNTGQIKIFSKDD